MSPTSQYSLPAWQGVLAVRGVDDVPSSFLRRLREVCASTGVHPDHLLSVISFETDGRFRGDTTNPSSGATGIIQWIDSPGGLSRAELRRLSATEQLPYVETRYKHFSSPSRPLVSLCDVYMVVFAPAFVRKPSGSVLYATGKAYSQNQGLDLNLDHKITKSEACSGPARVLEAAGDRHTPWPAPSLDNDDDGSWITNVVFGVVIASAIGAAVKRLSR